MGSRRQQLKGTVMNLLRDTPLAGLADALAVFTARELVNPLFSFLCHPEEIVRWRAVSAFGLVVARIAAEDMEQARVIMRRFLWMLNDESGGIGWGVPEAMGEVLANQRQLADEYLHLLVSYTLDDGAAAFQHGNLLEHEILQEGVLWGLCRVAPQHRERLLEAGLAAQIERYFDAARSGVRGLACRLCGQLVVGTYRPRLLQLCQDQGSLRLYRDGDMHDLLVADLAREALAALDRVQGARTPGGSGTTASPPRQ